ncbi:MAG: hypothetical protein Kow0074_23010 [Candidatus Zixiibacteriota bacterium]
MKTTHHILYVMIAMGALLAITTLRAHAEPGNQCAHGYQAAATDQQSVADGSHDSHQTMEATGNTGHMEKMKQMSHGSPMMDMSAMHGGTKHTVGDVQFETVFTESDVRLYVTHADGTPVDLGKLAATATITEPNDKVQTAPFTVQNVSDDPMAPHRHMPKRPENTTSYLSAPFTFGTRPDEAVSVAFSVSGIGDGVTEWSQPFVMTPLFGVACPMHPAQASLDDGECSLCGGMKMQPAGVMYGCCPGCPNMRSTSPQTCDKCGMEMELKSIGPIDLENLQIESQCHPNHAG